MMFQDRQQAGRKLAEELLKLKLVNPVVLALPRGAFRSLPKSLVR
jgi:putative phosphoribosyl transferase